MSAAIARLLKLASQAGLKSDDGQWSEAFVHWFPAPMPMAVREAGRSDAELEYFITKATPHTIENEGFIDRRDKVAVTFEIGSR